MAAQQERAGLHHHGEQIVEVVRDAGGKLADLAHLLALRQARFQFALLGDIDDVGKRRAHRRRARNARAPRSAGCVASMISIGSFIAWRKRCASAAGPFGSVEQIRERRAWRRAALRHFHQRARWNRAAPRKLDRCRRAPPRRTARRRTRRRRSRRAPARALRRFGRFRVGEKHQRPRRAVARRRPARSVSAEACVSAPSTALQRDARARRAKAAPVAPQQAARHLP